MSESKLKLLNGNGIPMNAPNAEQCAAMERTACDLAEALLAAGMALAAPDHHLMARILITRVGTKALAHLAKIEGMAPNVALDLIHRTFPRAFETAVREEMAATQRMAIDMANAQTGA